MKKQIKTTEAIFPMPVLLISTFNGGGRMPDRHKEVFSPHIRVVSKCALKKSRLRTKSVCFFVFNRYNEDVRFAH